MVYYCFRLGSAVWTFIDLSKISSSSDAPSSISIDFTLWYNVGFRMSKISVYQMTKLFGRVRGSVAQLLSETSFLCLPREFRLIFEVFRLEGKLLAVELRALLGVRNLFTFGAEVRIFVCILSWLLFNICFSLEIVSIDFISSSVSPELSESETWRGTLKFTNCFKSRYFIRNHI